MLAGPPAVRARIGATINAMFCVRAASGRRTVISRRERNSRFSNQRAGSCEVHIRNSRRHHHVAQEDLGRRSYSRIGRHRVRTRVSNGRLPAGRWRRRARSWHSQQPYVHRAVRRPSPRGAHLPPKITGERPFSQTEWPRSPERGFFVAMDVGGHAADGLQR